MDAVIDRQQIKPKTEDKGPWHTVSCAPTASILLPADQAAACDVGQRNRLAIAQGGIDVLAFASPRPAEQRGHDAVARIQPGGQISYRNTNLYRWPVSAASDVHQPEFGLHHHVVSRALRVRARLAISRDGCIDERRVDLVDCLVVQAILLQRTWNVVLYQNITLRRKLVEDVNSSGILERESQRLFVAVDLGKISSTPGLLHCLLPTPRKYADSPGPACEEPAL